MKQPDQHSGPHVRQLLELGFDVDLRVAPLDDPIPSPQGLLITQANLKATPARGDAARYCRQGQAEGGVMSNLPADVLEQSGIDAGMAEVADRYANRCAEELLRFFAKAVPALRVIAPLPTANEGAPPV